MNSVSLSFSQCKRKRNAIPLTCHFILIHPLENRNTEPQVINVPFAFLGGFLFHLPFLRGMVRGFVVAFSCLTLDREIRRLEVSNIGEEEGLGLVLEGCFGTDR